MAGTAPRSRLIPGRGRLTARVSHPSLPYPTNHDGLFYALEIPVDLTLDRPPNDPEFFPHKAGPHSGHSDLRLDHISLGLIDWRNLPGREFRFPVNPEPGYIDGSIYLQSNHNYADATRLSFGPLQPDGLVLSLDVAFDFSLIDAAPSDLPASVQVTWDVMLDVDAQELDRQMVLAKRVLASLG
jgi:hypothetical protein